MSAITVEQTPSRTWSAPTSILLVTLLVIPQVFMHL